MARPVTLFTGQWADLSIDVMLDKTAEFGYDGIELACWGDHFEVDRALTEKDYCANLRSKIKDRGLKIFAISTHLVGQATCDRIDERHKAILPDYVWGDGDPEGVRKRAAKEVARTAKAARLLGVKVVNGFTGSPIWHMLYTFPPTPKAMIDKGFAEFGKRWKPILDAFKKEGVKFGLEVHPTEIAFDIASAEMALAAVGKHPAFGFNYDPSHLGYQGVDYVEFIRRFGKRIWHVHMKDATWMDRPMDAGVFGGHLPFGDPRRYWDFRSVGRGRVDFDAIVRALNDIGYKGPLSVEWEDPGMNREQGAIESCAYCKAVDVVPAGGAFDAAFESK